MACEGLNFDLCRLFVSVSSHQKESQKHWTLF